MQQPTPPPTVSVVIPAYNRALTIRAAIESVLRQTWTDFELIVVDDASTDATVAEAAQVVDPRLRLIESPQNQGAAGARNAGIREARGAWVAFQDSDDEWLPRKLEKQMARLRDLGPTCVGAYCGLLTLGGLDDRPGERLRLRYMPDAAVAPAEGDILLPLLRANMISTQTLVVRRETILALDCFDAETTPVEDWDFVIRLAQQGPIAFVDEPLVQQRFSPNSITRDRARRHKAHMRIVDKQAALLDRHPDILAQHHYAIAGGHRAAGDLAAARASLARARALRPGDLRVWAMSAYVAALYLRPGRTPRT